MSKLRASVQYGDWEGTAAADDADGRSLRKFLAEKGHVGELEFVVAAKVWIGENQGGKIQRPVIEAIIADKKDFDTVKAYVDAARDPLAFKAVKVELTLEEFVGLFKRLAVTFTRTGLRLTDRKYKS